VSIPYSEDVPKLWSDTIEAHRREVHDVIVETTAALVAEHGLRGVTMSQIAEGAGIGRATLYKYFPDVESILLAWHERHVAAHLQHLVELREQPGDPGSRITAVLEAYALMTYEVSRHNHGTDLSALVHRGDHVAHARDRLSRLIRELLAEGAKSGCVRDDIAPAELAPYCLHALGAAAGLRSKSAVHRLVAVTLAGLRSQDC
jgi:AcrR family transcriptional regulator